MLLITLVTQIHGKMVIRDLNVAVVNMEDKRGKIGKVFLWFVSLLLFFVGTVYC